METLADDALPELDAWADIDTGKRSSILSSFQHCLPPGPEQEFLRAELLDVHGARRWAEDVSRV